MGCIIKLIKNIGDCASREENKIIDNIEYAIQKEIDILKDDNNNNINNCIKCINCKK